MQITLSLSFSGSSEPRTLSAIFDCPEGIDAELLQTDLEIALRKELVWGDFRGQLPNITELDISPSTTFKLEDLFAGEYQDRMNVREVWFEVTNTILNIEYLLANARSYKALEPTSTVPEEDNFLWRVHLSKMKDFNFAVFLLAKIEDQIFRLLYEGLGASFSFIDQRRQDWEHDLKLDKLKKELKEREANTTLKALPDDEYARIMRIAQQLRAQPVPVFLQYRHRLTHRLTPSVDYVQFSAAPQSRLLKPVFDKSTGEQKCRAAELMARPTKPDYEFLDLYKLAVQTLKHYIKVLRALKSIPRFSGE